jgi:hypothetical protein
MCVLDLCVGVGKRSGGLEGGSWEEGGGGGNDEELFELTARPGYGLRKGQDDETNSDPAASVVTAKERVSGEGGVARLRE